MMSTTQPITRAWRNVTERSATKIFKARPLHSGTTVRFAQTQKPLAQAKIPIRICTESLLLSRPQWTDKEYRDAYMEAAVEQGVAWQIKINRQHRHLSQKALASAMGTQQSAISRLEDPDYGCHSLETLLEVAKVFDCALSVKFVSYSELASDSENLSESDQYAPPYTSEMKRKNVQ